MLSAQEICDNGKDDGDGWIDLKDPDCQCRWQATKNILLNPSFEEYKHCPTEDGPSYLKNYDIAEHWLFGVQPNGGIAFYHNLACSRDSLDYGTGGTISLQLPLPDGNAFISLIRGATPSLPGFPENLSTKYYVAQCLQETLIKDRNYTLSFYGGIFTNKNTNRFALDSFTVAVFGHMDCNAVPFGSANRGNGCPANYDGWILLGKTTVVSPFVWVPARMDLTIPTDINVIEIGQDCSLPYTGDTTRGSIWAYSSVYYLDNFQLAETKDFDFKYITLQNGDACSGDYVLKAPSGTNATCQWYKDSIALVGEKDSILYVPEPSSTAHYNVQITKGGRCQISEPLLIQRSLLPALQIPADTFSCVGDTIRLGRRLPGVIYSWNGKQDTIVHLTETGNYNITASDSLGCTKDFSVHVDFKDCIGCKIFIPSAFTPNGDGLNEVLKGYSNCPIENYQLQIFNRWGQKLFETNDLSKGWDGTFNGKKEPVGISIYLLQFKNSHNDKNYKTAKGTVAIIR